MSTPFGSYPFDASGVDNVAHPTVIQGYRAPAVTDIYPAFTEWVDLSQSPALLYVSQGAGTWILLEEAGASSFNEIVPDTGTTPVTPNAGSVNIVGAVVNSGTHPIRTDGTAADTLTIEVQKSQALAAGDATKIGLSNFDSASFAVSADGFVTLLGGGQAIDSFVPNSGTNPVVPAADGSITLQGTGSITVVGGLNSLTPQLTGLTNHAVLVGAGTATITKVGPTATAGQVLQSAGAAADPEFSTATYPSTTTVSQILYSSNTNVVSGLATANDGVLVTSHTGVPSILAGPGTTGQILQANSAAAPSFSTASYPSTTTINQILYSSNNNVVGQITAANNGTLITGATGIPSIATLTNGQLIIGSTAGTPLAATLTAGSGISITNAANSITISSTGTDKQQGVSNIGITYSAGVFTITSANGTALSASNSGYVTINSVNLPGQLITIPITANQSFQDSAGVSTITGNSFGVTIANAAKSYNQDMPFFLYAVANSAQTGAGNPETAISFMISRYPNTKVSPIDANIAVSGGGNADTQGSFYAMSGTAANYASSAALCIGSFRMKSTNNIADWTVQTLIGSDGIGNFQENRTFTYVSGTFGNADTLFFEGAGPSFATNNTAYYVDRFNNLDIFFNLANATAGGDAAAINQNMPYLLNAAIGNFYLDNTGGSLYTGCCFFSTGPSNDTGFVGGPGNSANITIKNNTITTAAGVNFAYRCRGQVDFA